MGEIIQIITQKPFSINNIEWFKNTNINYQIQGRKSLTNIKGTWKLNQYFLYDIYENIKPFNAYYLSMLVDVDENVPKIDSEFNIGFNNTDFMYEKEFINLFMEEEIYLIIRPQYQVKNIAKVYSLFDENSKDYIENNYSVIYKDLSKIPTYIVKTKSLEELSLLDEYIYGYLINPSSNIDIQLNNNISFNDLLIIDSLMGIWETVIFRSPLYSNYNLTIYTRKNDNDYMKKRLHSYSELMTVKIEYI